MMNNVAKAKDTFVMDQTVRGYHQWLNINKQKIQTDAYYGVQHNHKVNYVFLFRSVSVVENVQFLPNGNISLWLF